MRRLRVQSPVTVPVNLHVYHPSLHEVRCLGSGCDHTCPLRGSGRHGDRVHTDVQEPRRASCAYCSCWDRYSLPAGSVLALLLWREDQRRQQEDRHGVSGLKRAQPRPESAWEVDGRKACCSHKSMEAGSLARSKACESKVVSIVNTTESS